MDKLKKLKKANLHLHLTGALTADDLRHLSKITQTDISSLEPLENKYIFHSNNIWDITKKIISTEKGLSEAIKLVLQREANDNVIYAEITINTFGLVCRGMKIPSIVNEIKLGCAFGETIGIKCKIKFGVNRKDGVDSILTVSEVFNACPENFRLCIDLNGNERKYPTILFLNEFKKLIDKKIPVSLHVGEFIGLNDSLLKAINIKPRRIAHAVAFQDHPEILDEILKNKILIELSPISNYKTGSIKDIKHHPIKELIQKNIPIGIGSDDPAFFKSSMTLELETIHQMGIPISKIIEINNKSLEIVGII